MDGAHPVHLDVLSLPDARALLARWLGDNRVAAEVEAAEEIIARCARLPLALAVTAARVATRSVISLAAVAAELWDSADGLDAFHDQDAAAVVRSVAAVSRLTPAGTGPTAGVERPEAVSARREPGARSGPAVSTPLATARVRGPAVATPRNSFPAGSLRPGRTCEILSQGTGDVEPVNPKWAMPKPVAAKNSPRMTNTPRNTNGSNISAGPPPDAASAGTARSVASGR